jgi:RHS repeat-associated protein
LTNRYLHGPAIDMVLADEQYGSLDDPTEDPGTVYWPLADNLGSVRDIVERKFNGDVEVVNRIEYDAFGNILSETDAEAVDHIFGFTGRERDRESHLQYNRARYYDPAIGRWLSEDPLGFAAGDENLYRYVGNGPTNAVDPDGRDRIPHVYSDPPPQFAPDWSYLERNLPGVWIVPAPFVPHEAPWQLPGPLDLLYRPPSVHVFLDLVPVKPWSDPDCYLVDPLNLPSEGALHDYGLRRETPITGPPVSLITGPPPRGRWRTFLDFEGHWNELSGYQRVPYDDGWYWRKKDSPSPIEQWAEDIQRIPFQPVPADTIAEGTQGNFGPAIGSAAEELISRGASKFLPRATPNFGARHGDDAAGAAKQATREGIYEFPDATFGGKPYVGQSGRIPERLDAHRRSGRLAEGTTPTVTPVEGGRTVREVAEHRRIQELTGGVPAGQSPGVANQRNPIGSQRQHLLKDK